MPSDLPKPSDLGALLAAANAYCALDDWCAACVAHRALAALAPALARKVLDRREVGEALAEAAQVLLGLDPETDRVIARWAELDAEEERDG